MRAPTTAGSVLLRHAARLSSAGLLPGLREEDLSAVSLGEELRLLAPFAYKGVEIALLDETTGMASGTFKSVDACLSVAQARRLELKAVVCGSGGNTGAAAALYAAHAGLPAALVVPACGARALRLTPACADTPLVVLEDAAGLKDFTTRLSARLDAAEVPRLDWRYEAGAARGLEIARLASSGPRPDVLSQTVSAGFGPIGVYRAFDLLGAPTPRFLGVQQSENCPFYRRWKGAAPEPGEPFLAHIYDEDPFAYGSFAEFERLLRRGGELVLVSARDYRAWRERTRDGTPCSRVLTEAGIPLDGPRESAAGLVGLAGVFAAIDRGLVKPGERVWHSLTSGAPLPAGIAARRLVHAADASPVAVDAAAHAVRALWSA